MTYRIRLLGGVGLEGPSGPPSGRVVQRRQLALLALLACTPRPLTREKAVGLLWPDNPEDRARHLLTDTLYVIRQGLGEGAVVAEAEALRLNREHVDSDVTAFEEAVAAERWREAVDVYGGPFMDGFHLDGGVEFDRWMEGERRRLAQCHWEALERLAEDAQSRGDRDEAVVWWKRRAAEEPTNSRAVVRLMEAMAAAGNVPGALEQARVHELLLAEDLDVPLPREVRDVKERLTEWASSNDPVPPTPPAGPPPEGPAARSGGRTATPSQRPPSLDPELQRAVPLVGRDAELTQLAGHWARVANGSKVLVVAGEAGVGKTRLSEELADRVAREDEAALARARCFPSRGRLALSPVAEWLRSPALRRGIEDLEPAWRAEVGRLVPELGSDDTHASAEPLSDTWQRRRFFEGLARAVLAGGRPTLLILDDLQWCDAETLAWLEVLVHLEPAARILVVATLRSEELHDNAELVACRQALQGAGALEEVELAPLGPEATGELAAALGGRPVDESTSRRLLADTGGFPLFLVESLQEGTPGPSRMDAVLTGRFARLSSGAQHVAGLAAAVGRDFSMELLARAGDMDDEKELLAAVDELWRRWLLEEHSPATYDFAHDLLRNAAYERLTPPQRRRLHRRIAAALEEIHSAEGDAVPAQVADQYERGGDPARAIHHHGLAAEAATRLFAHDAAVEHYERALELLSRLPAGAERNRREIGLLEGLVPSLVALRGYAAPRIGRALERMAELGGRLGEEVTELRAQAALSAHLFVQGRIHEAAELNERVIGRAEEHPEQVGQHSVARVWSLTSLGRPQEGLERADRVHERADATEMSPLGFPLRVMALGWRAKAQWLVGRSGDAATSAAAALRVAEDLDQPFGRAIAEGYAAIAHTLLGDVGRTAELSASLQERCDHHGFAYYAEWGRILEGWATGGTSGEALIRQGLDELHRTHAGRARPFWLSLLAEVLVDLGRTAEASQVLSDARSWAEAHGDRWWLAELWRLDAALDPEGQAEPMLEQALAVAREQGALALELRATTDLAARWSEAGRLEEARDLLEPVRARADGCNATDLAAADGLIPMNGAPHPATEG